jgi:cobalt-zinc-cadmium efflux system membrane fusion protein
MRRRFFISAVLFSSLFGAACNRGIASVSSSEHTAQNPAVKHSNRDEIVLPAAEQATAGIQTETVALSEAPDVLRVSGRIALADDRNWHVGVRTEGLVAAVYAGLGDHVKKGQVLARYHADQVHELRAQYRSAMANLNRVQAGAALAQRNCDRLQTLLSLKAASVQQVEQARQDLVSAQAEVQSAQSDVERAHSLLEDDLHVAAEPPAGNHNEAADDVPILAPATGYVIEKKVTPGKSVTPSRGDAFVIGDLTQVWMLASVRPEHLGELRVAQLATVTLSGIPGQRFSGKITNLAQEFDPITRVMQARIVLNNPGNLLRPEMLANAEISSGSRKPTILVVSEAVQQINGQDAVFVRTSADGFAVRAVRIGETVDGKTPVLEGLKSGEQVVVRGSFILKSQLLRASMERE